jgi:hypothetical protein
MLLLKPSTNGTASSGSHNLTESGIMDPTPTDAIHFSVTMREIWDCNRLDRDIDLADAVQIARRNGATMICPIEYIDIHYEPSYLFRFPDNSYAVISAGNVMVSDANGLPL